MNLLEKNTKQILKNIVMLTVKESINIFRKKKQYYRLNKKRLNKLRTTNRHKALEKLQKSKDEETLGKC